MQYIPCNSALLAQETLFLTQKGTFLPKDLQKVRKSRQSLKFSSESKLFGGCHLCSRATSAILLYNIHCTKDDCSESFLCIGKTVNSTKTIRSLKDGMYVSGELLFDH